jgi:Short repeat of unknown function (DUF308)
MPTITQSVDADSTAAPLGRRWGWLLALGIVEIIAGCLAIAMPVVASLAAVAYFGAVLIVTAIFQIIHAFQVRERPRAVWYGLGGLLYGIAGVLVVAYPLGGALTLAVLIAVLLSRTAPCAHSSEWRSDPSPDGVGSSQPVSPASSSAFFSCSDGRGPRCGLRACCSASTSYSRA